MRLSAYWSVLLLAVFAVGFLVAGAPVTKEAAAGAGFALAARRSRAWSTSLRSAAVRRPQPRSAAARTSTRHAGLPTWALIAGNTGYYELVATVANQLAHHGLQVPFQEAAAHLATVASGDTEGESARWLQDKIDHITAKLDAENER
jgi:hypothetical protein